MARQGKVYTFVVEGGLRFPVDMLRYDCCWPARGEDALTIDHGHMDGIERIEVSTHKAELTVGRWASFGWRVIGRKDRV